MALLAAMLAATQSAGAFQRRATAVKVAPAAPVSVQDRTFHSKALQREVRYRVLLPAGYAAGARRYPVLYLLHGLFGDYQNWETRTGLAVYAEAHQMIIVMPDGGNSWYANSATDPKARYEDFIVKDLIPEVDRVWPTNRSQHQRAIAGLSMGGYGAIKFALKYPGTFAAAGSVSGALNAASDVKESGEGFRADLDAAFGPENSATRAENDVTLLAQKASPDATPYLYVDCGISDRFFPVNHQFITVLRERRLAFEFHAMAGDHSWKYWDERLAPMMAALARKMRVE